MKKMIVLALAAILSLGLFAACGNGATYKAVKALDVVDEYYGFMIGKDHARKTEILAAMNKVIAELEETDQINALVTYHTKLSNDATADSAGESPVQIPDLSGCTGGTLRVQTNAAFAPYEYKRSGQIVGVDMDIMKFVAKELNMKVEFTDVLFDSIIINVQSGTADVGAAGISIDDARKEKVDFSNPYYKSIQYIICKEDATYQNIADLKGLRIGVQTGTTGHLFCDEEIKSGALKGSGAKVIRYDDGPVAWLGLQSNQVDVVVLDEKVAQGIVAGQK